MAEFQIVAKEIERLCKAYQNKCRTDECPLYLEDLCYAQAMSHIHDYEAGNLENTVMAWAAEHSEPKYPTWAEWLSGLGLIVQKDEIFTEYSLDGICSMAKKVGALSEKAYQPISNNIAEKLGIQPKEN